MQTHCAYDDFRIIFQDDYLLAVHKPAALLVHRSPIDKHETRFALQMARDLVGRYVYPVHRLDKATSGLLLFALDSQTAGQLGQQLQAHKFQKRYWALVRGWPDSCGMIDHGLRYKADDYSESKASKLGAEQAAITQYQCLAQASLDKPMGKYAQQRYALMQLTPQTGRKHQLRRHMNYISHPIIGDVNFGDRHHNHLFNDWRGYHRLYLASVALRFRHPVTAETLHLSCPLQNDFLDTLTALQIQPAELLAGRCSAA